jgi:hypothetical protein
MGLFSKSKPKTLFGLLKMKPDDIFTLKLEKVSEEKNDSGQMVYTYRAKLNQPEFGIFDTVQLVCWTPDTDLKNQPFNLFFKVLTDALTMEKIREVTNSITFGADESGDKYWTDRDNYQLELKMWTGRWWHFDETGKNKGNIIEGSAGYEMMMGYNEDEGFNLSVLGCEGLIRISKQNDT